MGRDTAAQAGKNSQTAQGYSSNYGDRAASGYNILTPTLNRMATSPQGFGTQTKANMLTAAKQSLGGSNAAIVGGSDLAAARTNNAGAYAPMATQAAHDATAALSDASLGIQNRDALLKQQQQQEGLSGLEGLYNTNTSAGENALGLSNNALSIRNEAENQTLGNWLGPLQAIGGAAASYYGARKGCWIAEAIYGAEDPRTHIVRAYLNGDFRKSWAGALIMWIYLAIGEFVAGFVGRSKTLRFMLRPFFDLALARAVVPILTSSRIHGIVPINLIRRAA
jgi:hypothetical protein